MQPLTQAPQYASTMGGKPIRQIKPNAKELKELAKQQEHDDYQKELDAKFKEGNFKNNGTSAEFLDFLRGQNQKFQKKGKKKMAERAKINIPHDVFLRMMRSD